MISLLKFKIWTWLLLIRLSSPRRRGSSYGINVKRSLLVRASLAFLIFFSLPLSPSYAQQDAWSYTDDEQHPGQEETLDAEEWSEIMDSPPSAEDNDPFEPLNRLIFDFNAFLDMILIEPLSRMYYDLVPEFARERVGYALRNLSEPVVFANNILQGDLEGARITLGRFIVNSTLGVAGLFDVSTDWDLPYKKEDFGLTLASWGVDAGPYLVLPILGPSNARDAWGRAGDYALDPINWWSYYKNKGVYSYTRTGVQILDAKTENLELMDDLKKNAIDFYATLRAWYYERRKDLMHEKEERVALDTPRPDDDDE
ncbi:MAG: VacJ family lipoprotein [Proteobacteria bacterium]|nr:VacJ family lipoprotein [Pseudomonadota bacterium]